MKNANARKYICQLKFNKAVTQEKAVAHLKKMHAMQVSKCVISWSISSFTIGILFHIFHNYIENYLNDQKWTNRRKCLIQYSFKLSYITMSIFSLAQLLLILILDYCLTDPSLHRRIYQTLVSSDLQSSTHEILVLGPLQTQQVRGSAFRI